MLDGCFFSRATMPGMRCFSTVAAPEVSDEEIEQLRRIDGQVLAHGELLAQRLPVDHQRQVDGELEHRAGADRAGVHGAPAHLIDDRSRARDIGGFAADQPEQLAGARRRDRAADRAFDIGRALAAHLAGQRDLTSGGTVLISMNSLPFTSPDEQSLRTVIDRVDRRGIGDDGDDGLDRAGELGRGLGDPGAGIGEGFELFGVRFQTVTVCPTSIRRAAMSAPIFPIPAMPICMRSPSFCSRR